MSNVRKTALAILNKCADAEQYSNLALDTALQRGNFSSLDKAFLTVLVYGTVEHRLTLDYWIGVLADRSVEKLELSTRNLLRMGLYQLAFLDRVPDHAAVNETVLLAPKRTKGFVNAVLRAFLRENKQIAMPDCKKEPYRYLSVQYSFAIPICEAFVKNFGFERTQSLFAAFGRQPLLTLRTNTLHITRDALLARLRADGLDVLPTSESPVGIRLLCNASPTGMPGFSEGDFFVQDEASQLCVAALDAHAGMTVMDVCACPGSKSFGAAMDMENRGRVLACDLHANKLSLVRSGAERLGISIIETEARDARTVCTAWQGIADRVLCDVPCSGFGVFAKKPDLRYKDIKKSEALPDIQLAIASAASSYVKKNGLLVYSTCTILPRENEENVSRFLERHGDFSLLWERTLYPDTDGTDGFYIAVLKRNG